MDVTPVVSRDFRWNATFTWSKNENRILSLAEGADENQLISSIGSVSIIGRVGGTTGDLWGYKLVRDPEGNVVINDNGLPERSGEIEYVGTAYPKWKAGLYNEFSYKNFTLSVLLDGQVGGKMSVSYTHLTLPTKRIVQIPVDAVYLKKKKKKEKKKKKTEKTQTLLHRRKRYQTH